MNFIIESVDVLTRHNRRPHLPISGLPLPCCGSHKEMIPYGTCLFHFFVIGEINS